MLGLLFGSHTTQLAQIKRQKKQRSKLGGKGLGRGHADLRSGVGINCACSFAGNHGATTLQMASVLQPLALASRWAAMVSAVSPDCVISRVNSLLEVMGLR